MLPPPPPTQPPLAPPREPRLTTAGLAGLALIAGSLVTVALVGVMVLRPGAASPTAAPSLALVATPAPTPTEAGTAIADPQAPSASPGASAAASPTPGAGPGRLGRPDALPTPPPAVVKLPKLTADIAGAAAIRYYAIAGDAPLDLVRQMARKGATHCEADALACVHLSVNPRVTYRLQRRDGRVHDHPGLPHAVGGRLSAALGEAGPRPAAAARVVARRVRPHHVARGAAHPDREGLDAEAVRPARGQAVRVGDEDHPALGEAGRGSPGRVRRKGVRDLRYPAYSGPGGWDGTTVP